MPYIGIGPEKGTVVEDAQAFEYALERCMAGALEEQAEFKEMLVEWYYSGNWIKGDEGNDVSV